MDKDNFYKLGVGDMSEISGEQLRDCSVESMEGGIADVIAVPNNVQELQDNKAHLVLYMNIKTYDGKERMLVFNEEAVHSMYDSTHQYRELMIQAMSPEERKAAEADMTKATMRAIAQILKDRLDDD